MDALPNDTSRHNTFQNEFIKFLQHNWPPANVTELISSDSESEDDQCYHHHTQVINAIAPGEMTNNETQQQQSASRRSYYSDHRSQHIHTESSKNTPSFPPKADLFSNQLVSDGSGDGSNDHMVDARMDGHFKVHILAIGSTFQTPTYTDSMNCTAEHPHIRKTCISHTRNVVETHIQDMPMQPNQTHIQTTRHKHAFGRNSFS